MGKGGRREEEGGRKEKGGYETPEVEKGGMRANQKHLRPYKKRRSNRNAKGPTTHLRPNKTSAAKCLT